MNCFTFKNKFSSFYFKAFLVVFIALMSKQTLNAQTKLNYTDTLGRKQGHWIKLDADKKKVYDGNFVDDTPTGKFTYFLPTGKPWAITNFSQNGKIAYTQHLNGEGKVTGEGKYLGQNKDSLWKFYNESGKLKAEESYLNGLKHGKSKVFYSNGNVSEEKDWKQGLLNGNCIKYFENGTIKSQRGYVNDKAEGKGKFNHVDGKTYAEGNYKNDVKDGEWIFYKEDGKITKKIMYINGRAKNNADELIITKEEEEKLRKQYEESEYNDSNKK